MLVTSIYVTKFRQFSSQVDGHELLIGTASFAITDAKTQKLLAGGTFLPGAGIFIAEDNTNHGIGFGSAGDLPTNSQFATIQPLYPNSMSNVLVQNYDLKSNAVFQPSSAEANITWSCYNALPYLCQTPVSLATTAGDLTINPTIDPSNLQAGTFTAQLYPVTRFSLFSATLKAFGAGTEIIGSFTLGNSSNGINPVAENVTDQIGKYSFTLPPSSFKRIGGKFVFDGFVNGTEVGMQIRQVAGNSYSFTVTNLPSSVLSGPTALSLSIGGDRGNVTPTR